MMNHKLYLICPFAKFMDQIIVEKQNQIHDFELEDETLIPEDLFIYTTFNEKKDAERFIETNHTNLYEAGSDPYCALVEVELNQLPLDVLTIALYQFDENSYGTENEQYKKIRNCTDMEVVLRPNIIF